MMKRFASLTAILCLGVATLHAANDWPWIYGPHRDNTSPQQGLLRTWPEAGPRVLWTTPVGAGFGGPAVSDGKVYLLDRDDQIGDSLRVFDLASGKELWTFAYEAAGSFDFPGSRTTPTVEGGHVYTVGPLGDLHAIDIATRKPAWRKNIWRDFGGGELPRWAVVQNPLIYDDLVIVAPQTSEASVVAYDKRTGELRWRSAPVSGTTGYVSPSIITIGVDDHLVMIEAAIGRGRTAREGSVNGLDPRTGRRLWSYQNWHCIIPVPLPVDAGDGRILITGGYEAGSAMIRVEKKGDGSYGVTELFQNPDFGAHTQPPVLFQGQFYAHYTINSRSDGLVAMGMDGKVRWRTDQQPAFVRGGMILADGLLLMTDGNTKLYLVEPDPKAFKPIASAVIFEPGDNWAPLALAEGTLLARGQKELKALRVVR